MEPLPVTDATSSVLDAGRSLELIKSVVERRRIQTRRPGGRSSSIVSDCLQRVGIDKVTADGVQRRRLRDLYASRTMPIRLTLGAAVALDAAQRGEWLGFSDDETLAHAIDVTSRLPGLISDRVLQRINPSGAPAC